SGQTLAFDDDFSELLSSTSREAGENTGTYNILALFDGPKASNYSINFDNTNKAFEIKPLEITVTAINKQKEHGATDPEMTYEYTPNLISGDVFSGNLSREAGENVGVYKITQGNLELNSNYILTFIEGEFEILPAT